MTVFHDLADVFLGRFYLFVQRKRLGFDRVGFWLAV